MWVEYQGAIGRDWKEQFVKSSNFLRIPSSRSSMEICQAGWQERGTKNEIFWHITSPSASQPLISTTLLCHSFKFNTRVASDKKYKQDFININAVQYQHWQFTGWISKTQIQRYELPKLQIQNRQQTTSWGFKVVRRWHFRKCSHGHFVTFVTCFLFHSCLINHDGSGKSDKDNITKGRYTST